MTFKWATEMALNISMHGHSVENDVRNTRIISSPFILIVQVM